MYYNYSEGIKNQMNLSSELNVLEIVDERPMKISVFTIIMDKIQMSSSFRLIYVLDGKIEIQINSNAYELDKGQFALINPFDFFYVKASSLEDQVLAIDINKEEFKLNSSMAIDNKLLISSQKNNGNLFTDAKTEIEKLLFIANKYTHHLKGELFSTLSNIVRFLSDNHFYLPTDALRDEEDIRRIKQIIDFALDKMTENLSLKDVAENVHLNYYYLSHFFSTFAGFSFKEFILSNKIYQSLERLRDTDDKIIDIAIDSGFNSTKTYYQSFSHFYAVSPNDYRKCFRIVKGEKGIRHDAIYIAQHRDALITSLGSAFESIPVNTTQQLVPIDFNLPAISQRPTRFGIAGMSRAFEILYASNQKMIKEITSNIDYEYIKLRGIFNDEMMIYNDEEGDVRYNFSYLDQVVDFVLSLNLKPFIELDFMPKGLASSDRTLFYWRANMSLPNDYTKWGLLIENTVRHLADRYGAEQIRTWRFDCWNKPDYHGFFFTGDRADFFKLYQISVEAAKRGCPLIKVGGPNTTAGELMPDFLENFFNYVKKNNIPLDFVSIQVYGDHFKDFSPVRSPANFVRMVNREMNDINYLGQEIEIIRKIIGPETELFISEFNVSARTNFFIRDSSFMGPYLLDSVRQSWESISSLCSWTLSDAIEEIRAPIDTFHGGLGLMTYNNIPKASFFAFQFLNRLYPRIILEEPGCFVSEKDKSFTIILYNLAYFDKTGINSDFHALTVSNTYSYFKKRGNREFHLAFNIPEGNYFYHKESVSRKKGSAFDEMIQVGFKEPLSDSNIAYLKEKSRPETNETIIHIKKDSVMVETLEEHEMAFIQITPIKT